VGRAHFDFIMHFSNKFWNTKEHLKNRKLLHSLSAASRYPSLSNLPQSLLRGQMKINLDKPRYKPRTSLATYHSPFSYKSLSARSASTIVLHLIPFTIPYLPYSIYVADNASESLASTRPPLDTICMKRRTDH